jgi:hypothetical protein
MTFFLHFVLQKIEKLKSGLHMLDNADKPKNKHTFFVDSKKEGKDIKVYRVISGSLIRSAETSRART